MRVVAATLVLVLVIVAGAGPALASPPRLEVFVRPGCSHCERAKVWLDDLRQRRPDISIVVHDVASDRKARARLIALAKAAGVQAAVPAFYARERLFVGFDGPATTGAEIEAWLDEGDAQIEPMRVGDRSRRVEVR